MTKSTVGVHEAKTNLSRLLDRVAAGEEIEIARRGTVVARLVPAQRRRGTRTLGFDAGRVHLRADFDDPLPAEVGEPLGE